MLFPTDPHKRPELWDRFSEKIDTGVISFIVHMGRTALSDGRHLFLNAEKDEAVNAFRSAHIARFGSDRGQAIGPFFAFNIEGERARLVEFAIDTRIQGASDYDMQEAVQSVAINLFFEEKEITQIILPFALQNWDVNEWEAVVGADGTVLNRNPS